METKHKKRLAADFPGEFAEAVVHVLDIPDDYQYMDSELVEILTETVQPLIDSLKERRQVVTGLVDLSISPERALESLEAFPWDCESELVTLTREHLREVLRRFLSREYSVDQVAAWAGAIECRDDIGVQSQDLIDTVFDLANPLVNGELTREKAGALLAKAENSHHDRARNH